MKLILLIALCIGEIVLGFNPAPAPFWWLNTFLKDQTIGRFETGNVGDGLGPCPRQSKRCEMDLSQLPPSVKAIGVDLPDPFDKGTVGGLLPTGFLAIYKSEVRDVEIGNTIIGGELETPSRQRIDVTVESFKAFVKTALQLTGLTVPVNWGISESFIDVDKSQQTTGTQIDFEVFVEAPPGKTLGNSFPKNVSLGACHIVVDLSITISNIVPAIPYNPVQVVNLLLEVAEPLLGDAVCGVIRQLFVTFEGEPGIVNVLVGKAFDTIANLTGKPDPLLDEEDNKIYDQLTPTQREGALTFKDNIVVKGASKVLNGWLGAGDPDDPVVNEVIELLTTPDEGTAVFTDLQDFGLSFPIHTPVAVVTLDLHKVTVSGLNTFGLDYGLQLLKNNYEQEPEHRLNYTLMNRISLHELRINLEASVTINTNRSSNTPPGWINVQNRSPYGISSTSFNLNYSLGLDNLDVEIALAFASDASQLKKVRVGELLGKQNLNMNAVQQLIVGGQCSAPAMYAAAVPFLKVNLENVVTPVFSMAPSDAGLTLLVNDVTTIVLNILEGAITQDMALISQHLIRPLVNDLVRDFFVSGGAETDCPEYEDKGKISPNLQTSTIFSTAKELIRDVIGGDPVIDSPASINELVRQVILFSCEILGSTTTCQELGPGEWEFLPSLKFFPGRSFPAGTSFDSSIQISGLEVSGANSIHRLLLDNVGTTQQGVNLLLDIGTNTNRLEITLKNHWQVDYDVSTSKADVDEKFDIKISIEGFKVNLTAIPDFDLNQLYLLRFEDLGRSACVLAPLLSLFLDLRLSTTDFEIDISRTDGDEGVGPNPLRAALNTVVSEQAGYTNINHMFGYVLNSIAKFANHQAENIGNAAITSANCFEEDNKFDTFVNRLLVAALSTNFTQVFQEILEDPEPVPSAEALDASVFVPFGASPFDLEENFFVPLINEVVMGTTQESFFNTLQTLANNSGDILSDSFHSETDGSISLDINFLQYERFQDGFDLSSVIDGAKFFINRVSLSNVDSLDMNSLRLVEVLSKFVTNTHIKINGVTTFHISLGVLLPREFKNDVGEPVLTTLNFTMGLENLDIALQTLTALDQKKVNGLSLGNFIQVDEDQTFSLNPNGITCFLRLFMPRGLSLPQLQIKLDSVVSPTLSVDRTDFFISQGVVDTVNAMITILADFYVQDLGDLTQNGLRTLLNKFLLEPNLERPGFCQNPAPPNLVGNARILNFKQSATVSFVNNLTSAILAGKDGQYRLFNTVVSSALNNRKFFRQPEHELGFNNLSIIYKKQSLGEVDMAIRDISLNGLGSFSYMDLLRAETNTSISNNLSLAGPFALGFGIKWNFRNVWVAEPGNDGLTDEIEMDLTLTNVTLGATINMAIDIPDLLVVQAGSFTNFSQISCVLTAVQNLSISNFTFDVDKVGTKLRCAGLCESPLFKGIASGGEIKSGDGPNNPADFIPQVIELAVNYVNSPTFNQGAQDAVDNAEENCASQMNFTSVIKVLNAEFNHGLNVAIIFGLALIGIGCALAILAPLAIPRHYQLKDKMLAQNLLIANSQPGANAQSVARFMAKQERDQVALAFHPAVNKCCKCFVPVMAIANVVLLALSFVVYLSFSVDARLFVLGSETKTYTLVPWFISSTINDMWNSGAWPLSILIVFASCAWPVVKNIALFFIWFAPKTFLNHEKRDWLLVLLDILGKWSFLDVYIINILVGVLRFTLVLSNAPLLQVLPIPQSLLVVDVIVTPGVGIVLLCVAAFMSLIVNHVIIWEMLKSEWADRRLFKQIDGEPDDVLTPKANIRLAISEYVFSTTTPDGQRDRYGPKAKNSVILLIGFAIVFLIIGYNVPYFTLTYDGLVGIALSFFIQGGRRRTFTLITIGAALPAASTGTPYSNVLMLFFTVLYFTTVVIAPVVQMILHLFLWLRPLSIKDAKALMFFAKVAAYWASIEVFCLGIIATTIEIQPVTFFLFDFITGGTCTALKSPLTDILGGKDGSCLTPGAFVDWGFPISFASNLFQIGVGAIMIRASGVAIRDREDVLERQPHKEWTYLEYVVLNKLLVHGAEHHKPVPDPNKKQSATSKFTKEVSTNPTKAISDCFGGCCKSVNCFSCFTGVDDVGITAPVNGKSHAKVTNSKWNAPPSHAASSKWNAPSSAPSNPSWNMSPSANPSWNVSSPTNSRALAAGNSMNMDTPNPVFAREQQSKRYSIDV